MTASMISLLIEALVLVEGSGVERADAFNAAENAAGSLQIRMCVLEDLRGCGYAWADADRFDPAKARSMARVWLTRRVRYAERHLGAPLSIGRAARLWCAGPDGWRQRGPQTDRYAASAEMYAEKLMASAMEKHSGKASGVVK